MSRTKFRTAALNPIFAAICPMAFCLAFSPIAGLSSEFRRSGDESNASVNAARSSLLYPRSSVPAPRRPAPRHTAVRLRRSICAPLKIADERLKQSAPFELRRNLLPQQRFRALDGQPRRQRLHFQTSRALRRCNFRLRGLRNRFRFGARQCAHALRFRFAAPLRIDAQPRNFLP